jgi:hypothetical protein
MQSLLESLIDGLKITEYADWLVFMERLHEAVRSGKVRKIPVLRPPAGSRSPEEWFQDPTSGEVYRYFPPNPPVLPTWKKIDVLSMLEAPSPTPLSPFKTGQITPMMAHIMKLRLEALISCGLVEELTPSTAAPLSGDTTERWFRDSVSEFVYRLSEHYGLKDPDDIRWEIVPKDEVTRRIQ